ncbi:regulator of protease activity HflC (stomatin/prohibitin superfamily) [Fictibacillus halophilus]|uniref:Regulator of protease activity HflC (Stomatin/prohibitin superfamily) n=1 Tax=Fictibacillus halophilus TaxID=1610490 RepID=A0ABV2LI18_9BACL|nr:slipin family protein [Fictibacillus halophilus]
MESFLEYLVVIGFGAIVVFAILSFIKKFFASVTVYEYERGVKFHHGAFQEIVGPGKHKYSPASSEIMVFDMRPTIMQLNGQELLTADHLSVKISVAVKYQITDPQILISEYEDYEEHVYMNVQLKLRDVVSSLELDDLLGKRNEVNDSFENLLVEKSFAGLSILSVDIKDIMLSAELKKAFLEVIKAKKEAQSSLERARGEAATLRSLVNSAKLLENNPVLAKLRLMNTIENSKGNTFVIDMANGNHSTNQQSNA